MKKRCLVLAFAVLLGLAAAFAEEGRITIHPDLPPVTLTIEDAGASGDMLREHLLCVKIASEDGSLAQEVTWQSAETAAHEGAAALVQLRDMNFDGYNDLLLLAAQGARNVFQALSVYDPEAGRFGPVLEGAAWSTEEKGFTDSTAQLELCSYDLYPEQRRILSSVADGYRFRTEIVYEWEGRSGLVPKSVLDVYDAGEGMIGELLTLYATGITRCWDVAYPEAWYHGRTDISAERISSCHAMTLGRALTDPVWAEVTNVSWVNLRRQDSKASPSLAKLTAGTEVQVLAEDVGIGDEAGWVRVYLHPEEEEPGLTGYIWHSYLR